MCAMLLLQYKYSFVHMIATPRNLALLSTLAGSFIYRTSRILEVFFFHRNICAKGHFFQMHCEKSFSPKVQLYLKRIIRGTLNYTFNQLS